LPAASATVLFLAGVIGNDPPTGAAPASGATLLTVTSPNRQVVARFSRDAQGRLTHEIAFRGSPVLEPSPIVLTLDGVAISEGIDAGGIQRDRIDEKYRWHGVHAEAVNRANVARLALTHRATRTKHTLEVHVADDGVAFRHVVPGAADATRTPDETTAFAFPGGSTAWYHDFANHYESLYVRKPIEEIAEGEWAAPPVTVKLPGGLGYAAITEGGLVRYAGMGLQATGARGLVTRSRRITRSRSATARTRRDGWRRRRRLPARSRRHGGS
jgi:alpha-glucosidase